MTRTINELNAEQQAVVLAYAAKHGRKWKAALADAWMTGRDASQPDGWALRQVRNQFGPKWLAAVSL